MKEKLIILILCTATFANAKNTYWKNPAHPVSEELRTTASLQAASFRLAELDYANFRSYLAGCPHQANTDLRQSQFYVELPHPDGYFSIFKVVENQLMHPDLAAAYPEFKTYSGQGIDDPAATLKFDLTLHGFHAMVISPNGTYVINPVSGNVCMSYLKSNAIRRSEPFVCYTQNNRSEDELHHRIDNGLSGNSFRTIEGQLRTYRLALACTGEYATYHGGTTASALAAMIVAMNRVNGVYEREFGITMQLIPNDTVLIFLNPSTDPYTNNNGATMLGQNQTTCDNLIGNANYDIGHVFSTGGGGIAQLAVPCKTGQKAKGVTGLSAPVGDPFYIDYVCHEMGHQFAANHSFNTTVGSCNGNINYSTAWEPGSGSTIMSYAGICGSQNLQNFSNDYFHTGNFDEVINYTQLNVGNNCPTLTTVSNLAPVITSLPANQIIPLNTPFRLTAVAIDPDGDPITYCWEQYDLGPAGTWNNPSGNAPIFRSFLPVTSPTRLFPKLQNILNNNTTIGEIKPSYARQLKFRCTVRDNILAGAGVTYNDTPVTLTVDGNSGPFEVTSQNTPGVVWTGNSTETVTWNVANTDNSPINCSTVNVVLSLNGGTDFTITLGSNVPNNGSYSFIVPNVSTNTARVMVEAAGNIFFDINNSNFTINPVSVNENPFAASISVFPNPAENDVNIAMINEERGLIEISVTDNAGRVVYHQTVLKTENLFTFSLKEWSRARGYYLLKLKSENYEAFRKLILW
jgi:hypothetical protein